jgi:hypothetical protein
MGSANVTRAAVAIDSANSPATTATYRNTVFHNNWPVVMFGYVFGPVCWFLALCASFLTIDLITKVRIHHLSFWLLYGILQWSACAYYMIPLGWSLLKHARSVGHFRAKLDEIGVEFRLGSRKKPDNAFFAWDQIATVNERRSPSYHYYSVVAKNGESVEFTSLIFLRPNQLAREIARRANLPITQLTSP